MSNDDAGSPVTPDHAPKGGDSKGKSKSRKNKTGGGSAKARRKAARLAAAQALLGRLGAQLAGASVLIELDALRGRALWQGAAPLHALLHY